MFLIVQFMFIFVKLKQLRLEDFCQFLKNFQQNLQACHHKKLREAFARCTRHRPQRHVQIS